MEMTNHGTVKWKTSPLRSRGEYPRLLFRRTALPALKEKTMAGTPDRDGRYGFRKPGGPSVSWYAVSYDLLL